MSNQRQDWHHSGASCCTPFGTCLLSWCCPCITYGRTHHRVRFDGSMQGYSCCNGHCMAFTGLACLGLSFILPMIQRGDIRAKYHLSGNGCKDCLCACCCQPCDLTQQDKEVAWREDHKTGIAQQPQQHAPMQYQKQPQDTYGQHPQQFQQHPQQYHPQGH
ncbi:PLAC8-domain-containing protein [Lindgomyces ingoldianus]|uniref:PLAC8-domain-containing protein n=1 Tax=Lindgomyces ingoldianus TaxID=673940 RepID=A0ACB6R8N9_9PLEO|nr:PLAC8-domain-containing protein [Lindgomyces ingoldianus]KAF2475457.1 PLAC8-domain-containing protein [Lindgomyces ingoldianus]